jgi:hypothetical protein
VDATGGLLGHVDVIRTAGRAVMTIHHDRTFSS